MAPQSNAPSLAYYPNSVLSLKNIINLRRSPDQYDTIYMKINEPDCPDSAASSAHPWVVLTLEAKYRQFEHQFSNYIAAQSRDFYPTCQFTVLESASPLDMAIAIQVQHRGNFQNSKLYKDRRSKLIFRVRRMLESLKVSASDVKCKAQFEA
jgi:hypothetical protein